MSTLSKCERQNKANEMNGMPGNCKLASTARVASASCHVSSKKTLQLRMLHSMLVASSAALQACSTIVLQVRDRLGVPCMKLSMFMIIIDDVSNPEASHF